MRLDDASPQKKTISRFRVPKGSKFEAIGEENVAPPTGVGFCEVGKVSNGTMDLTAQYIVGYLGGRHI